MIANLLNTLIQTYGFVILARVIVSWLPIEPDHPVVRILDELTEPVIRPIRSVLPPFGGLDFSPFVALLLLEVLRAVLIGR